MELFFVFSGKLEHPSGYCFEGMWEDDSPHGRGIMMYPSGIAWRGLWQRGVPVQPDSDVEETQEPLIQPEAVAVHR